MRPAIRPLAPSVVWNRTVVAVPGRDHLIREDHETISRREEWIGTMVDVNGRSYGLLLNAVGNVHIDFAEVRVRNGQVQVVDFRDGRLPHQIAG